MKLEVGKKYVLNNGDVVGPIDPRDHSFYPFRFDFPDQDERGYLTWNSSGEYLHGNPHHPLSIACEFVPAMPAIEEAAEYGPERIPVGKQRDPRVIVVDESHDGQFSFGELSQCGEVWETTATGETLQVIEGLVLKNRSCGMITRYQEKFIFVAQRYKSKPSCVPAEPPEHPADREQGELQSAAGVGMTNKEKEAMEHLVNFWNAFLALPDQESSASSKTVCDAVHMIQGVLAIRVARRANPEVWR